MNLEKVKEIMKDYEKVFELDKKSLLYFLDNLKFVYYQEFCEKIGKKGLRQILNRIPPDHLLHYCFKNVQHKYL